jgi:GH15 family glucan-1,4-alpha-glucosidase
LHFLDDTQDSSGAWWQRYLSTGHAGPSWGRIQIDETATALSAAYIHFHRTKDFLWLEKFWPTFKKGLHFLESFQSENAGMGVPSHDLWEERMGIHAYSLASIASAFLTGSYLAGHLMETDAQAKYYNLSRRISSLIKEKFLSEKKVYRSLIHHEWDETVDVSLLGLIRPFAILPKRHPVASKIVDMVRTRLWHPAVGGIIRYERDIYRGGNPWVLTTLWLAQVELALGHFYEAREMFRWSMSKATSLGMLPEQVHRETGKPYWVIPLGWSHAMFLLFVREVMDRKVASQIWEII